MNHLDEAQVEAYAMGRLPEADAATAEEHLLVCADCRGRVVETEAYIRAMRDGGRRWRDEHG